MAKTMSDEELKELIDKLYNEIKYGLESKLNLESRVNKYIHYSYGPFESMIIARHGDLSKVKPAKIKAGKGDPNRYGTKAYFRRMIHEIALKDIKQIYKDRKIDFSKIEI